MMCRDYQSELDRIRVGISMLSKKERVAWVLAICVAIVSTFFIINRPNLVFQDKAGDATPTVQTRDIAQEAEAWFTSSAQPRFRQPPLPARSHYDKFGNIDGPLLIYQDAVKQNIPWINYPEQIALRVFYPPPETEGFVPNEVSIYYYSANIVTVTIVLIGPYGAEERRFDFVKIDNIWKIVWVGSRSISLK
jgi:hypothetical protein